jgi:alpha-D-xyloside xylohydrolase
MTVVDGTLLLRRVTSVRRTQGGVAIGVDALPGVQLGIMPGWLTGESPEEQGIETQMPNLPELDLPPVDPTAYELKVSLPSDSTVRITLAVAGAAVLDDDGTWLGIVTDPGTGAAGVDVTETASEVIVTSSRVRLRIGRAPFTLAVEDVASGAMLIRTAHRLRQVAGLPMAPAVVADSNGMTLNLELGTDEDLLGFGEQFGRLVKNGQKLVLRSEDACGTGTGLAYKPVPVWHSSAGYLGFVNTGATVTADVGHTRPSVLGLTVADEALDLYVVAAPSPKDRLTAYTALTGRPEVPPLWAFGYWMGRCRYHSRDEMLDVVRTMREHEVPLDVMHCDPDWLIVDRLNCDFIWNESRFGDRKSFVDALAADGVRLSVWELPYLDPVSPRFEEARDKGYLARTSTGELAAIQKTPTSDGRMRALIDFTNPDALAWWQGMHEEFLADGVAVFKTDFGEALPDDVQLYDGTPPAHAHNLYPLRYNAAVSDAILRYTGRSPLVWGRSGWAGSQRYPGQWGGDAESTVAGMLATVRGGLSYAMSAPGFWSHDIGGFFGPELTPGLYVRWTQLGALSPLMRAHGLRPREPWQFGPDALEISRRWVRLRYELLPYLWQVAHESARSGWPLMRPLGLEFPDDVVARSVDDSFMLGSDLLVVPVFDDGAAPVTRRFYLPEGRWVDLLDETVYTGPGFQHVEVPLDRVPVLVRSGAAIPRLEVGADVTGTPDLVARRWVLHTYGDAGRKFRLIGFDGTPTEVGLEDGCLVATGNQLVGTVVVHDA